MRLLITALSLIGFAVSAYIAWTKRKSRKLVCMIGKDCDKVVRSAYSNILGLPNEWWGMVYYGGYALFLLGLGAGGGIRLISPSVFRVIEQLAFFASGLAAVFSLFLIFVQAFLLREWCEYCLLSAGISIVIFSLAAIVF